MNLGILTPEQRKLWDLAMEGIETRTFRKFKVAHILSADGVLRCLDLDVKAKQVKGIQNKILEACVAHTEEDQMNSSPPEFWLRFILAKLDRAEHLEAPHTKTGRLLVVYRTESHA